MHKITKSLPSLEVLDISFLDISSNSLQQLKHCNNLKTLNLSYSPQLSDHMLGQLKCNESLESLSIAGCENITDAGLAHIVKMRCLKWLDCSKLEMVTDHGLLRLVKELKDLEYLCIQYCDPRKVAKLKAYCEKNSPPRKNMAKHPVILD